MPRFQAKQFALTFPQASDLDKKELFDKLKQERNLKYLLVAQEAHKDGGVHFHCHIVYERVKDIKNPRYFDTNGNHPNIQVCKRPADWNRYCKKEDEEYLEWGNFDEENDEVYNLFDSARGDDRETFVLRALEHRVPPMYATMAWEHVRQVDTSIYEDTPINGTMCPMLNIIDARVPRKSVCIIGPTGCGKTTYAKKHATKPALFIRHVDQLKRFDTTKHRSIIFDDMSFIHWPVTGQICLADFDDDTCVNVKHSTAFIPKETEKWFTCNAMPFVTHEAIARRLNVINLY